MNDEQLSTIDSLIKDVFNQAQTGIVNIKAKDGSAWRFFIRFYTEINGCKTFKENNKAPILFIPNYNAFLEKTRNYLEIAREFYKNDKNYFDLSENEFDKKLFLDLIINASNFDFIDVYKFLDKRQRMLEQKQPEGEYLLGNYRGLNILCKIKKNRSNLESPYKFDAIFKDSENEFLLPSILFGLCDDTAYVMGIQNFNKIENPLSKKLDRFFRKVNKSVNMEEIEGNVSPNALVSFTIFNEYMQQQNISKFKATAFMPLRYSGNKIAGYTHTKTKEEAKTFLKKHNHDQYNITNKLMYMFIRYQHHFNNSQTFYDSIKQEITLAVPQENTTSGDNIIYDIANSITQQKQKEL